MHFRHFVIVPSNVSDVYGYVSQKMYPFDENLSVPEWEEPVSPKDLRRMKEFYKTTRLTVLLEHMEDWDGTEGFLKEGELWRRSTHNRQGEWDWWRPGGRYDGYVTDNVLSEGFNFHKVFETVENNIAPVSKVLKDRKSCYSLITPDGLWHEKIPSYSLFDDMTVFKEPWFKELTESLQEEWDCRQKTILENFKDNHNIVCCDYHS